MQSGAAYIVIKEEKNVNELGNSVPKLVPYDYSSDEDSKQNSEHDVKSNNGDSMSASSDGKSNDEGSQVPMLEDGMPNVPFVSADDFELYFKDSWDIYNSNDEEYGPRSPEVYEILTDYESCDSSVFIDMLKENGCSESGFRYTCGTPGLFCASLHKKELKKIKGDPRIVEINFVDSFVCDSI